MSVQRQDVHGHLARVLADEGRLLAEFEGILTRETDILRGEDSEAITRIGDHRQRCVEALTQLDAERAATCRMLSFGTGTDAMVRLLEWADPAGTLLQRWSQNLEIARSCKLINDRNGAIVSAKLGRVQQLLGKLRGSAPPAVYSARGGRYAALGSRNLGCA